MAVVAAVTIVTAVGLELKNSWIESGVFREADRHLTYRLAEGKSASIHYPGAGPYDWTLAMRVSLRFSRAWRRTVIESWRRHHSSELLASFSRLGLYPVYQQKDQAGLRIVDRDGRDLYSFDRPARVYPSYSSIPPLVVQTLLFIENRDMLDSKHPTRNPAVEWDRLGKAVIDYSLHTVDSKHPVVGGSTLATQLEKLRHSPGGRTSSPLDKLRQMTSATLGGLSRWPDTLHAQQEIIRGYINSIPLAASQGYGDVQGLGDGLVGLVRRRCFEDRSACCARREASLSARSNADARARLSRGALATAGSAIAACLFGGRSQGARYPDQSLPAGAGRTRRHFAPRCAIWH